MRIHKLSHCCLVIDLKDKEGKERRVLLDPGFYSVEKHSKVAKIDLILVTHEHADHFHMESIKQLLKEQPKIKIISNDAVGEILTKEGIAHHIMMNGDTIDHEGIHIEAHGKLHAIMHGSIPQTSNIGFLIRESAREKSPHEPTATFFFPGDAFTEVDAEIDLLALPVSGPWMKISEAIDYALALKPKKAFPVHDAVRFGSVHLVPEKILGANGIEFIKLEEGGEIVYS